MVALQFLESTAFSDSRKGPIFRGIRPGPVPLESGIPTSRARPVRRVREHEAEDEDLLRSGNGVAQVAEVVQGQQPPDKTTGELYFLYRWQGTMV